MSNVPDCLPDVAPKGLNCLPINRDRSDSKVVIHEKWGRDSLEYSFHYS